MSFFDQFELDAKSYKLYNEIVPEGYVPSYKRVLFEGELTIKSAKGLFKSRYFKIQDRKLLMFSKKTKDVPHGYFDLMTFVLICMTPPTKKKQDLYSFRLSKFNKFYDFYSPELAVIKNWFSSLKLYCISQGFCSFYEKLEVLGKGHFAQVFKVRHRKSGELYAAKVIQKDMPEMNRELVFKEVKIVKQLPKNENILKMYEIYEEEKELILIMELMEGGDLHQLIKKKKQELNEKDACYFFHQILRAVQFLHSNGVVHRDIKPENLLLTDKTGYPVVKLADFSLAEVFIDKKLNLQCGTPGFIAPEIFNENQPYDETVDIFSLGITLFMLLTGANPFKGRDAKAILDKNKIGLIKFKKKKWKNISSKARKLVTEMIAKNPQYRIPISNIIIHKWVRHDHRSKHSKENENSDETIGLQDKNKNASLSTRITSTCKLSSANTNPKPMALENAYGGKLFNSVHSIYLASEESSTNSSCISGLSRDCSLESFSKRSKFSNVSLININLDRKSVVQVHSSKKNSEIEPGNENFISCDEESKVKILISFLNENRVLPRFNLKFDRGSIILQH